MIPAHFEKVIVRYLESKDYDAYARLELDSETKRYVGGPIKRTHQQIVDNMGYQPTTGLLAIAERTTDDYIGRCGFLDAKASSETELHIILRRDYRKKGIALEIVPFLVELAKSAGKAPSAIIDPSNKQSIELMTRLGWVNTGPIKSENYQNGHIRYIPS